MREQSTQPRSLRQRVIHLIEGLAVIIAVVITLAYINEVPASDVPDTTSNDIAQLQPALAEVANSSQQTASIDIDVVKSMAWQEVVSGNYQAAIAQYNIVLAMHPDDIQALLERGIARARSGDHNLAIDDYTTASQFDPNNALIYYNRGISYDALGMTDLALDDYDHSIRKDGSYAYTWNNRGYVYASQGDWSQAINDYTQAINLDPTYATAYNNRAIAYVRIEQLDNARTDYEKALELNPNYMDAQYNYGVLLYKQGDYQGAMNAFHIVVKSDVQKTPQMWNNHGSALHRLGQYSQAITSYSEAIRLDPDYELARLNRAIAYRDLGEYELSIEDYTALLARNPFRYDLYLARGNVLESIEPASSAAGTSYLQYLRRNGIIPHTMQEVLEYDFNKEFQIERNQLHQFRVYVNKGDTLDFSVTSSSADNVDPMIVLMQSGYILTGNDDTDQTLNSALFDVHFEESGWVNVYIGLAGGGVDNGQVLFSIQPVR